MDYRHPQENNFVQPLIRRQRLAVVFGWQYEAHVVDDNSRSASTPNCPV
jgi:hypothetical protein